MSNAETIETLTCKGQVSEKSGDGADSLSVVKKDILSEDVSADTTEGGMSHQKFMEAIQSGVAGIIQQDPLLCHLPPDVTVEELNSAIALEHGQAMTVMIHKADCGTYSVIVEQTATVLDLKKAVQRHFTLRQSREKEDQRNISWRYVWKTYWLSFEGRKLTDDSAKLKQYSIGNNSELKFVKKLRVR